MYFTEYKNAVKKEFSRRGFLDSPINDLQIYKCYFYNVGENQCVDMGLDVWAGHEFESLMDEYFVTHSTFSPI